MTAAHFLRFTDNPEVAAVYRGSADLAWLFALPVASEAADRLLDEVLGHTGACCSFDTAFVPRRNVLRRFIVAGSSRFPPVIHRLKDFGLSGSSVSPISAFGCAEGAKGSRTASVFLTSPAAGSCRA